MRQRSTSSTSAGWQTEGQAQLGQPGVRAVTKRRSAVRRPTPGLITTSPKPALSTDHQTATPAGRAGEHDPGIVPDLNFGPFGLAVGPASRCFGFSDVQSEQSVRGEHGGKGAQRASRSAPAS